MPVAFGCAVEEDEEEGEEAGEEGGATLARTDSLASSSSFWESLLRPHYLRFKREEEVRFSADAHLASAAVKHVRLPCSCCV